MKDLFTAWTNSLPQGLVLLWLQKNEEVQILIIYSDYVIEQEINMDFGALVF